MNARLPEAVVIFGASGFVGRNIVDILASQGTTTIYGITNRTTSVSGCAATFALDRLDAVPLLPNDTVVMHVAARRYHAATFGQDQSAILRDNARITQEVYHFCARRCIAEVRLASSVAVYPAAWDELDDMRAIDLNAWPHKGEGGYAWSKRWSEICAEIYYSHFRINTLTFRLTNPYGPHDSTDVEAAHVAAAFLLKALSETPTFEVRGNPDALRDFVFVGDVARVLVASLYRRGEHNAFNLASGRMISMRELANAILKTTGTAKSIVIAESPTSGVAIRHPTFAKLRRSFPEAVPFVSLEEGLRRTMDWYRKDDRGQ